MADLKESTSLDGELAWNLSTSSGVAGSERYRWVIRGRPQRQICTSGACPNSEAVAQALTLPSPIIEFGTSRTIATTFRFAKKFFRCKNTDASYRFSL